MIEYQIDTPEIDGQLINKYLFAADNHDITINSLGDLTAGIYIIVFNSINYIQSFRLIKE